MKNSRQKALSFVLQNSEAFVWMAVIMVFALSTVQTDAHFTICPLSIAGFENCPGCGLGRSMILLLHGRIADSFSMHPLGIFAFGVFVTRIVIVFRNYFHYKELINQVAK